MNGKNTLEILISTMNLNDLNIIDKMKIKSNSVIINQCDRNSNKTYTIGEKNVKLINRKERGISRSRNEAIKNSSADICMLTDDDVIYKSGYEKIILDSFQENPDYHIICFCLYGIDKKFKKYSNREMRVGYIRTMKIASVEIAFRRRSIIDNNIKFNELFGTGSGMYSMGEENIFLYECLRKGLKIKYVPIHIADIYVGDSTWFKGYNEKYFYDKGAAFTAMSRKMSIILIFQFAIRKVKLYKNEIKLIESIKYMLKGRREYLKSEEK